MKETAVQWLMHQMLEGSMNRETGEMHIKLPKDAFTIAKEMEKEQIENAYEIGFADAWDDARYDDEPKYATAEQYYKETYESND